MKNIHYENAWLFFFPYPTFFSVSNLFVAMGIWNSAQAFLNNIFACVVVKRLLVIDSFLTVELTCLFRYHMLAQEIHMQIQSINEYVFHRHVSEDEEENIDFFCLVDN